MTMGGPGGMPPGNAISGVMGVGCTTLPGAVEATIIGGGGPPTSCCCCWPGVVGAGCCWGSGGVNALFGPGWVDSVA